MGVSADRQANLIPREICSDLNELVVKGALLVGREATNFDKSRLEALFKTRISESMTSIMMQEVAQSISTRATDPLKTISRESVAGIFIKTS